MRTVKHYAMSCLCVCVCVCARARVRACVRVRGSLHCKNEIVTLLNFIYFTWLIAMFCLFVNALYDMNVTKTNLLLRTFKCQWRINILASNLVREADIELLASAADSGCMQINFASSKIPPV